jgi:hypothetical protein
VPVQASKGSVPLPASVNLVVPMESAPAVSKPDNKSSPALPEQETPAPDRVSQLAQDNKTGAKAASVVTTTDSPADGAGAQVSSWRLSQGWPTQLQVPEKFAAPIPPGRSESSSGVNPPTSTEEKKSLSIDEKALTPTQKNVGTGVANRENAMPYSAVNKASAAVFSSIADDRLQQGNVPGAVQTDAPLAAQAPRLVQEIRQIADRISVIDRNTVEVSFDFSDRDRLSVRVEYRDGTVHTTFRTDSSQLRDAISHEWQAQSAVTEQRSYRVAEPVFSQTTSDRQNFSTPGDGSGRQRAFEQPAQSAAPSFTATVRNAGSTTSAAVPAARSFRPETSLHLHALA